MDTIKTLRKEIGITQLEASKMTGIPLRTFKDYENNTSKIGSIKYQFILSELQKHTFIDEEHGMLSIDAIQKTCEPIFKKYNIEYAILFGSYAKGVATEKSDVDLLISTDIKGIQFYGIAEELRVNLKKKVDLLDLNQVKNNDDLLNEILKDGVRIYDEK